MSERPQDRKKEIQEAHDEQLIDFVREVIPQLNMIVDRLEKFVTERPKPENE